MIAMNACPRARRGSRRAEGRRVSLCSSCTHRSHRTSAHRDERRRTSAGRSASRRASRVRATGATSRRGCGGRRAGRARRRRCRCGRGRRRRGRRDRCARARRVERDLSLHLSGERRAQPSQRLPLGRDRRELVRSVEDLLLRVRNRSARCGHRARSIHAARCAINHRVAQRPSRHASQKRSLLPCRDAGVTERWFRALARPDSDTPFARTWPGPGRRACRRRRRRARRPRPRDRAGGRRCPRLRRPGTRARARA